MTDAIITIAGTPHNLRRVAIRHMNFGQHWRTKGITDLPYELRLPHVCLRHIIESQLEAFVEDAKKFPEDDEFEMALRSRNWPDIDEILGDAELRDLSLDYFALDILRDVLDAPPVPDGFVLNTICNTSYEASYLRISGLGARVAELKAYQDI